MRNIIKRFLDCAMFIGKNCIQEFSTALPARSRDKRGACVILLYAKGADESRKIAAIFGEHICARNQWTTVGLNADWEVGKTTFAEAAASICLETKVKIRSPLDRWCYSKINQSHNRQVIVRDLMFTPLPLSWYLRRAPAGVYFAEHLPGYLGCDVRIRFLRVEFVEGMKRSPGNKMYIEINNPAIDAQSLATALRPFKPVLRNVSDRLHV